MQKPNPLGFQRIDSADAAKQKQLLAEKLLEENPPAAAAAAAPPKRPVGRPPKQRALMLSASAEPDALQPPAKRNTNWFSSPFIRDVLEAVHKRSFCWRAAVTDLQRSAPSGDRLRYAQLSDSTIRNWFEQRDGRW